MLAFPWCEIPLSPLIKLPKEKVKQILEDKQLSQGCDCRGHIHNEMEMPFFLEVRNAAGLGCNVM